MFSKNHVQLALFVSLTLTIVSEPGSAQTAVVPTETEVKSGNASRQEQLALARQYVSTGRFWEAKKITERLLLADPNDAEASALRSEAQRGLRELQNSKVQEAEELARKKNATDADRRALAEAYFEAGRYAEAATRYKAIPDSARDREMTIRYARALSWSGQSDAAEAIYLQLLSDQDDPALQLEHAELLSWMGASRPAVTKLQQIYDATGSEEALLALANARSWSGERDEALKLLQDYLSSHPDSPVVKDLVSKISESPEIRLERIDKLITVEPFNLALRVQRARLLLEMKRYGETLRAVRFVEESSDREIEGLAQLKAEAERGRSEELARIRARLDAMEKNASSPDELLELARAYSAVEEYDEAISLYQRYLNARPDDVKPRIEFARLLGWDRRYNAARREFKRLIEANPERADLRFEYAQILSYDSDYRAAVSTFRGLTDLSSNPRAHLYSDVPTKAHFNLGQIYRWFGWNEHAVIEQNSALELDSAYDPARRELDLVRHIRPATNYDGRFSFSEDSSGFKLTRIDLEGQRWISQRQTVELMIGRHMFERDRVVDGATVIGPFDVNANVFAAGSRYRWRDRWTARGRVGINVYDEGLGTRPFWNLGAEVLPSLQSRAVFDYAHYDLVYDAFTAESLREDPIRIDDFRAHWDYTTGGHWSYLADLSYGFLSEERDPAGGERSNQRLAGHGLLTYRIIKKPFVAVKGDYRYLSYDFRSRRYWSPQDYHSVAAVLHIGDNIRSRFFWQLEGKVGRSFEGENESDTRSIEGRAIVPINDRFDLVGGYGYGRSERIDPLQTGSSEFGGYWQRRWYVGIRVKRLFRDDEREVGSDPYYYEERGGLDSSPVIPPVTGGN